MYSHSIVFLYSFFRAGSHWRHREFLGIYCKEQRLAAAKLNWNGWRKGLMVVSTGCSYRGPRFGTKHPHSGS